MLVKCAAFFPGQLICYLVVTFDAITHNIIKLASIRVFNVIGLIKRFKIVADKYRNHRRGFGLRFSLIAGVKILNYASFERGLLQPFELRLWDLCITQRLLCLASKYA
jgi:hypothetical protein